MACSKNSVKGKIKKRGMGLVDRGIKLLMLNLKQDKL